MEYFIKKHQIIHQRRALIIYLRNESMRLHSIYLSRDETENRPALPGRVAMNLATFRACYPNMPHELYNLESGRYIISANFDRDVVMAFDHLVPLAYKADLLRYCLLYVFGGVYADLGMHFFLPVKFFNMTQNIFVFRDGFGRAPWIVSNSLILAKPKLSVFEACITAIVRHVKDGYYGLTPLCPTGPNLFGRELSRTTSLEELACGETVRINRSSTHSFAYLDASGDVIAVNVKRGAGLRAVGGRYHEDYNKLYAKRQIYAFK